jgi:hypothetical protein
MSATPTYDTVVEELRIDPERIAARPPWSFEVAERLRKRRKKVLRTAARKKQIHQPVTRQVKANRMAAAT